MNNQPLKGSEEAVLSIGIVLSCPENDLLAAGSLELGGPEFRASGTPASHMVCAEPGEKHDFHQGVFP